MDPELPIDTYEGQRFGRGLPRAILQGENFNSTRLVFFIPRARSKPQTYAAQKPGAVGQGGGRGLAAENVLLPPARPLQPLCGDDVSRNIERWMLAPALSRPCSRPGTRAVRTRRGKGSRGPGLGSLTCQRPPPKSSAAHIPKNEHHGRRTATTSECRQRQNGTGRRPLHRATVLERGASLGGGVGGRSERTGSHVAEPEPRLRGGGDPRISRSLLYLRDPEGSQPVSAGCVDAPVENSASGPKPAMGTRGGARAGLGARARVRPGSLPGASLPATFRRCVSRCRCRCRPYGAGTART